MELFLLLVFVERECKPNCASLAFQVENPDEFQHLLRHLEFADILEKKMSLAIVTSMGTMGS